MSAPSGSGSTAWKSRCFVAEQGDPVVGDVDEYRPYRHTDAQLGGVGVDDLGGEPGPLIPLGDGEDVGNAVGEVWRDGSVGDGVGVQRACPGDLLPLEVTARVPGASTRG